MEICRVDGGWWVCPWSSGCPVVGQHMDTKRGSHDSAQKGLTWFTLGSGDPLGQREEDNLVCAVCHEGVQIMLRLDNSRSLPRKKGHCWWESTVSISSMAGFVILTTQLKYPSPLNVQYLKIQMLTFIVHLKKIAVMKQAPLCPQSQLSYFPFN